jgi:hypothetical protein
MLMLEHYYRNSLSICVDYTDTLLMASLSLAPNRYGMPLIAFAVR